MNNESPSSSTVLPVMEHFYTIQGEGFHQGKAAYFIRLGGCDVGCPWCDVKESWEADKHPLVNIQTLVEQVTKVNAPLCVITGGEPLMHNLDGLTTLLKSNNIQTNIETSGAYPLSGTWDWICVSPKRYKLPVPELLEAANELKIVIYHPNDFRWAEEYATQVKSHCKLYLQPEWSVEKKIVALIVEYVKQNPKWEISLQLHKYMNVP